MVEQHELMQILQLNTIGQTILVNAIKEASWLFKVSTDDLGKRSYKFIEKLSNAEASLIFIQGTGLEMMLDNYGVAFDAEEIRKCFYNHVGVRKYF